jgi:TetR/AcrR family transcriptional regulator, ethionamide resistance regulator
MSAGRSAATGARRRRRSPEVAEQEIIDAAEQLLRERPFRELTVDEVMRRTDLSRPSFYVYFRDRHHLVLKVVERLQAESAAGADLWYQAEGSGRDVIREATAGVVSVFARHGAVLQALADAAADDVEVEAAYRGALEFFIDATARHIEREIEAGNMLPCNAAETARALSIMNDRYMTMVLGRDPTVDPEVVVDTLTTIWVRTLYGTAG